MKGRIRLEKKKKTHFRVRSALTPCKSYSFFYSLDDVQRAWHIKMQVQKNKNLDDGINKFCATLQSFNLLWPQFPYLQNADDARFL